MCAYVDGLRSRLLKQAAGWKGDVYYQEVVVRGGPESLVGQTPSMQAQADHAWRYWWRQGGFGLLEAAARRHAHEGADRQGAGAS